MKKALLILSTIISLFIIYSFVFKINAVTYYVDATNGNDANNGTSPNTPWKTLTKLNNSMGSFVVGDSILLKRGEKWVGDSIVIGRSGLKFSAYGTGPAPIISGLKTVTGWTAVGGGLYKAPVAAPYDVRYVTVNGSPVEWGTTPDRGLGQSSYNYVEAVTNGSPRTFTDNQLSPTPDRTGNHFVIKGETWAIGEGEVISHTGTTCSYRVARTSPIGGQYFRNPRVGSGYIWVGNIVDCTKFPEWAYDSTTQNLNMFFGALNPNSYIVKISTVNTLFSIGAANNISIENIDFEGANDIGVYARNGSGFLTVKKCKFNGMVARAIMFSNTPNIVVEDDSAYNVLSISFRLPTNNISGASIQRNYGDSTNAPFETMGYNAEDLDWDFLACGMSNSTIIHNTSLRSGYMGIWFTGSNVVVDTNHIAKWGFWSNDCGATYTHALTGRGSYNIYTNRVVRNNWAHDATAWPYGFASATTGLPITNASSVKAFYNDDQSMNVLYTGNTCYNVDIGTANNLTAGVTLTNNVFMARRGLNFSRKSYSQITNFSASDNIFSNMTSSTITYYYLNDSLPSGNIAGAIAGWNIQLNNNISNSGAQGYGTETYTTDEPLTGYRQTFYNITGWQSVTGLSGSEIIVPYLPFAETGRKVLVNWANKTSLPIALNGVYKDYRGNTYSGLITLPRYTILLIYYTGPIVPPSTNNTFGVPSYKVPIIL